MPKKRLALKILIEAEKEKIKLRAAFFNNLAVASFAGACITPIASGGKVLGNVIKTGVPERDLMAFLVAGGVIFLILALLGFCLRLQASNTLNQLAIFEGDQ